NNIILEITPYLSSVFVIGFGSILYKLLFEQQEKKLIKKTFLKYINPYIMEELLNNPKSSLLSLGGEKRIITVVFTDIRQFTNISEKMSPENVVEFLNQYFEVMNSVIFKYNGTVDKYIGDSIMFFWNAPLKQPDHELLALNCVLEMFSKIEELNSLLWKDFKLQIGVGINTGEAIVGNIGSSKLMEYTAVGDTVNIASRLQDLTKEYNSPIIISEFVYQKVYQKINNKIPIYSLGKIKLRGKEKEIEIFKVGDFCYY
ncbi:MAG: adenylate/guanylate cyclase domain-containing protein, partial [Endomicrobiia bacterium]